MFGPVGSCVLCPGNETKWTSTAVWVWMELWSFGILRYLYFTLFVCFIDHHYQWPIGCNVNNVFCSLCGVNYNIFAFFAALRHHIMSEGTQAEVTLQQPLFWLIENTENKTTNVLMSNWKTLSADVLCMLRKKTVILNKEDNYTSQLLCIDLLCTLTILCSVFRDIFSQCTFCWVYWLLLSIPSTFVF